MPWDSTPRIFFCSPEPGSGKTRCLEVTELLVPRPVLAVNCTSAYLFRRVGSRDGLPTILFDEIDTVFGPRAKSENEEVRGLLNAGHRQGAVAGRCVVKGKTVETEELPAYAAVALAGLDDLPDTLMDRSIVVRMRRRAPSETVQPFRRRELEDEATFIRAAIAEFADTIPEDVWPEMPAGVTDRPADVWEALLAVADAAGGEWPARARVTCVSHVTLPAGRHPSLNIRLLEDLRSIFGDREHMLTVEILDTLNGLEESPWGDLRGKPLDARRLAHRLSRFQIKRSKPQVRVGSVTGKGYSREDLADAWTRYLDPLTPADPEPPERLPLSPIARVTSVTSVTESAAAAADTAASGITKVLPDGLRYSACPQCGAIATVLASARDELCGNCQPLWQGRRRPAEVGA